MSYFDIGRVVEWGNRCLQAYPDLKLFVLPIEERAGYLGAWAQGVLTPDCGITISVGEKSGYDVRLCGVKVMFSDKLPKGRTLFRVQ